MPFVSLTAIPCFEARPAEGQVDMMPAEGRTIAVESSAEELANGAAAAAVAAAAPTAAEGRGQLVHTFWSRRC